MSKSGMRYQKTLQLVKKMEDNGYTYTVDGDVYFDVKKFNLLFYLILFS